ncbi:S9 family peptidase [Roseomonas terrae]|uniref:prolyl oligopeptidase n=1 Tax=Neoroseomonas terrae TaxID=424799 RepID=A0ABS5EI59_9PROT|nr:prolyl oligopeptidase family serine peptidase [Neoroseomonas terrae]MBR0650714.1 S9 family peptidase [Neoroseomonas terrae]
MPDMHYPETARIDVIEERFGRTVTDPYRWLEGDAGSDPRILAWIEAQNAVSAAYLEALPGRDVFRERMAALLDYERYTAPVKRGGRYFFTLNRGRANQPSLFVREGSEGLDRLLIDPNAWSDDSADALGEWSASDDGRLLAFGVQVGGTDWRTIRVLDVDSGRELEDRVEWARFTQIAWAPDGSGFFYSRYPRPEPEAMNAPAADHAICFHRLGTPQEEDRLIFATPDRPALLNIAGRADAGRYLHISSTPGTNESALAVVDLEAEDWTPRTVVAGMEAEWLVLGNVGTRLVLLTTEGAERRRVVSLDMAEAEPTPVEIVPEAAGQAVVNDAAILGGRLLVGYLVDVKTEVRRFRMDGRPDGVVTLPGIGTAGGLRGHPAENEAFFVFTSYDRPTTVYRYEVAANRAEPWAEPVVPIDLGAIVVEQRFYSSKDGTKVPLFLVRRRDVTGAAPTLLYGYGGFGISLIPVYNPLQIAWVEQGGVLAVANIRGGGEYGRAWHRAGRREMRQNAFDDFIAAAEFLKAEGITPPDGLAIQGESGGGLLVGAVTNQRPDLFNAALPGVGVMDMLRYDQFTGGVLWMPEFGSPAEEAHFANLLGYSPYHAIRPGRDYPAILVTTADADDRVVPAHSFKYVAALQAVDLGRRPRLARIETRAGHGGGMPLDKAIALHADMWAFAARWTGLAVG